MANKIEELQAQVDALTKLLQQAGVLPPDPAATADPSKRADYVAFGSAAHAAFLGLVEVKAEGDAVGRNTYKSPLTGRVWMLEDEITGFIHYPDPKQAAMLVLRQKVNELDTPPSMPAGTPAMWQPREA